jgi:hypothetical protein
MDGLLRLLCRHELICTRKMSRCEVERVHCAETAFRSLMSGSRFDPLQIREPDRIREVPLVEGAFQRTVKENCLGNDFEVDERARQKNSAWIIKDPKRPLPVDAGGTGRGDQYARVQECPQHAPSAATATFRYLSLEFPPRERLLSGRGDPVTQAAQFAPKL